MPPLSPDQLLAAYQSASERVRARVVEYVTAVWANSPDYRDSDIDRIVARILPMVQAGQLQVAQLTDSYIGHVAALAGVLWIAGVDKASILGYRGVPPEEVYRRPAVTTYTALSRGADFTSAVDQGLSRLVDLASTDIQQARNRQAAATTARSGFKFFRRVLTGAENCAFCVIVSTQRYTRGDLMPIHPGCDCSVEPITGSRVPPRVLDPDLLARTHDLIDQHVGVRRNDRFFDLGLNKVSSSGQRISDYTELIIVNQHGELGPTLAWRSDHFTTAADLGIAV